MSSIDDVIVYKRSYQLAVEVHRMTLQLPQYLQYDLADQIRRASRSIPSNIREGLSRNKSARDKKNFLSTALGSNDEVLFNLQFMRDTDLLSNKLYTQYHDQYTILGKQLTRFIQHLHSQQVSSQ